MVDGLTPLVAFPLVLFAALAVPSAVAHFLFGMMRDDPDPPPKPSRRPAPRFCGSPRPMPPGRRFGRFSRGD